MATNKRLIKSNDDAAPVVPTSFNTVTYSGTSAIHSITGVGFQPDFVWIKSRSGAFTHSLQDSVRGSYAFLHSNLTAAENTNANRDWFRSFNSDGFTLGPYIATSGEPAANWNESGYTYVAWCWKAGGAAVTNTDGTITSQVSANTEAGFSVVTYEGNVTDGATVGHGLNNAPKMIIVKGRDTTYGWLVYHADLGNTKYLVLNTTSAETVGSTAWNNTSPTSNVFTIGSGVAVNQNSMVAYCFAEVPGFSKFGSYVGTGTTNTPTIDCGFEPAFVMIKCTSDTMNWAIFDNKRDTTNPNEAILYPNLSLAETNSAGSGVNFLANGFQINSNTGGWINTSGYSFIYMAFANQF